MKARVRRRGRASLPRRFANGVTRLAGALYKALDAEDVIIIVGFVFVAAGMAAMVSAGAAMLVVGALLLYLGLWHRTLIARSINGTAR